MKNLQISAAVCAALLGSSGAFALNQAQTAAAPLQLVVAGSSAARDTFQTEFAALCQAGTVNNYRVDVNNAPDFRAYSCTLNNAAPVPAAIRNTNTTIYYRSEGGSVWGPGAIGGSKSIKRLLVDGTCSLVAAPGFGICTATYTLDTDAATGHLTNSLVDLGVADEEPGMFRGENWFGGALGDEPAPGALEALPNSPGFGQVFGILVNNSVPLTSISKQDVASIFAGVYTNWNQVQDASGNPLASGDITVCRREAGSGTQNSAAIYFLAQNCGVSSTPFVTGGDTNTGPFGNPVFTNASTSSLETCVGGHTGSIGMNVFKSPAANASTKYIAIDGVAPSKVAAAQGKYAYWMESSFAKRNGLSANQTALADFLIGRAQSHTTISGTSASAFALPNISDNAAVLPVAGSGVPTAVATKSGNTCNVPVGQN